MIDFTDKPTLTGDLVVLRPVEVTDVEVLHVALDDAEVSLLTGTVHSSTQTEPMPWTLEQLREIYGRWTTADDRIAWVIVERATGEVVGEAVINDLDQGNRSCGFRIWISGARGRGLGTEATRLAVTEAFSRGVHRVELDVYDHNPRARHVYEKVGFRYEGTKRDALWQDDRWIDCHLMAMINPAEVPAD